MRKEEKLRTKIIADYKKILNDPKMTACSMQHSKDAFLLFIITRKYAGIPLASGRVLSHVIAQGIIHQVATQRILHVIVH
jgi:hypothetical protein